MNGSESAPGLPQGMEAVGATFLGEVLGPRPMVDQIGILTNDLRTTLATFVGVLGVGPFEVFRLGADQERGIFRGEEMRWDALVALAPAAGGPQIEVLQPLWGDNMHSEYVREHGTGIQHYGCRPADFDEAYHRLSSAGFDCVQESIGYGQTRDGRYAYFDTRDILHGMMLEIIRVPTHRWEPIEIWQTDGTVTATDEATRPWPR